MDREHLTRLIDDPARVQRDDIADLKAMAERYPWFSGAHLLLAVGGHREGDVLFDEQLKASAAHLPSRAVLFDRLHAPLTVAPVPIARTSVQPLVIVKEPDTTPHEGSVRYGGAEDVLPPIAEKPAPKPVAAVPIAPAEALPVTSVMPPAIEAVVPLPLEPTLPEVEAVEALAPPPAEQLQPAAEEATPAWQSPEPLLPEHIPTPWKERLLRGDRDEEELDRQMRDSAVAISYELLLESEGLLETPPVVPAPAAVPEPMVPVEPVSTKVAEPVLTASRSFSDWLSSSGTGSPKGTQAIAKDPAPSRPITEGSQPQRPSAARPIVDPEIIRAVRELAPVASKHTPENPETKALIDRFLQQNTDAPKAPKKAEFFNPQTAAKRSLEEHADLVTETLARIYEKQGNIAKAIAAYERLAVKHPEKSAHFRALAKALSGR